MVNFVAVFRGRSPDTARLIAITLNPTCVAEVTTHILREYQNHGAEDDPALAPLERGRYETLRRILQEADHAPA